MGVFFGTLSKSYLCSSSFQAECLKMLSISSNSCHWPMQQAPAPSQPRNTQRKHLMLEAMASISSNSCRPMQQAQVHRAYARLP